MSGSGSGDTPPAPEPSALAELLGRMGEKECVALLHALQREDRADLAILHDLLMDEGACLEVMAGIREHAQMDHGR